MVASQTTGDVDSLIEVCCLYLDEPFRKLIRHLTMGSSFTDLKSFAEVFLIEHPTAVAQQVRKFKEAVV